MRKPVAIILALFYLLSVTGLNIYRHTCMNQLAGWALLPSSGICPACGMEKSTDDNSCCKDESAFFKNTIDQQSNTITVLLNAPVTVVPPPVLDGICTTVTGTRIESIHEFAAASPPLSPPLHLLFRVFRI